MSLNTADVIDIRVDKNTATEPVSSCALQPIALLLRGYPYGDTGREAYARQVKSSIRSCLPPNANLNRRLLSFLAADYDAHDVADFRTTAGQCELLARRYPLNAEPLSLAAAHLSYLAADSGCQFSAWSIASQALKLALASETTDADALDLMVSALGWLSAGTDETQSSRKLADIRGEFLFVRLTSEWRRRVLEQDPPLSEQTTTNEAEHDSEIETEYWEIAAREAGESKNDGGVVVVSAIGSPLTGEGRRVSTVYGSIAGNALPLLPTPDLACVSRELTTAFPHADGVIRAILAELSNQNHVRLRPTILVGPPGCGKTTFARELTRLLGVPCTLYSCGGTADPSLAGTPRRWQTGEPCLPVMLALQHDTASPGILLDELEKAGTGTQNGRLHDALLGMLEPTSARYWLDPYLQAEVDISHVVWVATANSLDGIPCPLRDRCRILTFPAPTPSNLTALAPALLKAAVSERGLDAAWATPLDGVEMCALQAAWRGGSLRGLQRLLDGVLSARDCAPGLN